MGMIEGHLRDTADIATDRAIKRAKRSARCMEITPSSYRERDYIVAAMLRRSDAVRYKFDTCDEFAGYGWRVRVWNVDTAEVDRV
jgi:hypothetical protein